MSELERIRAHADETYKYPTLPQYIQAVKDRAKLIAALDAVVRLIDLADSKGIVSGRPLEVDTLREAIKKALGDVE